MGRRAARAGGRLLQDLEAGCDQLGGEGVPELVVELVEQGRIVGGARRRSARRMLRDKFRLGLFDDRRWSTGLPPRR